jgi:hypothetical protein
MKLVSTLLNRNIGGIARSIAPAFSTKSSLITDNTQGVHGEVVFGKVVRWRSCEVGHPLDFVASCLDF